MKKYNVIIVIGMVATMLLGCGIGDVSSLLSKQEPNSNEGIMANNVVDEESSESMKVETNEIVNEESAQNENIPELVKEYVAPSDFSDNIEDCVFRLDGDYYKLPCPLNEFLNNGWELQKDVKEMDGLKVVREFKLEDTIDGSTKYIGCKLRRGDEVLFINICNLYDEAVPMEYAFVDSIHGDIELSEGISFGSEATDELVNKGYEEIAEGCYAMYFNGTTHDGDSTVGVVNGIIGSIVLNRNTSAETKIFVESSN